ncbi:MAG: PTS sugar transporter subunit IIA [Bifidobacteriaceae bacterium]|jgi:PTS system ascorbate-specific IIA component|nr:PTS sugar transporter subunit IIA [Bifidobacteriaceae bacterium]
MADAKVTLGDLLNQDTVKIVTQSLDFHDAIVSSLNILLDRDQIESRYIDSVFENFEKLGPYFYLGNGIAMPHSRPEEGAKALGLSLLVLKKPTIISQSDPRPVEIVLGFAATDPNQHVEAMAELAGILGDEAQLNALKSSNSVEEVLNIMKNLG